MGMISVLPEQGLVHMELERDRVIKLENQWGVGLENQLKLSG